LCSVLPLGSLLDRRKYRGAFIHFSLTEPGQSK